MKTHYRLTVILLLAILLSSLVHTQTIGDYRSTISGNWNSISTWEVFGSGGWVAATQVPDLNNSTEIRIRGTHTVTVSNNINADQIIIETDGKIVISENYTLTVFDGTGTDLTINGTVECHGTLAGNGFTGQVVVNGSLVWDKGALSHPGVTVESGGTVTINGESTKSFRFSTLTNNGTIVWSGTGNISGGAGAHLINQSTGIVDIQNDASLYYDFGGGTLTVSNAGTLKKSAGSGTTTLTGTTLNNTGSMLIESGTFSHSGGGTHSGSFTISAGCSLVVASGTNTTAEGTQFLGSGTFIITGGSLSSSGTTNGTTISAQTPFYLSGGSIEGAGKLNILGIMHWNGESYVGVSSLIIASACTLHIEGSSPKYLRFGNIYNSGLTIWSGTGKIRGGAGSVFTNQSSGIFDFRNDTDYEYDGGGGTFTFNNAGTLKKSDGSGNSRFLSTTFNNTGTVQVQSGALYFASGGTHSGTFSISASKQLFFSGGTHAVQDGASFTGAGSLEISGGELFCSGTGAGATSSAVTTINFSGGSITGNGKLTVNGVLNWSSPNEVTISSMTIASGGVINFTGDGLKRLRQSGRIINHGIINWTGTGNLAIGTFYIDNESDGVFNIVNDASMYYDGGGGSGIQFTNNGVIQKSTATGITSISSGTVNNTNGSIRVETGTLNLNSTLSNFSSNTMQSGAYYVAGVLKFNSANIVTNNASITLDGVSSQILNNTGDANALASLTTIGATGTLALRNGRNLSTSAGTLTCNGTIDCAENTISGAGNFVLASGGRLRIGSADGITSTGATGNIQNSGSTRSFHENATYEYTGAVPQVTGNGLPPIIANLTTNCTGPLTLSFSVTVTGILTMTTGIINTNSQTLTLGQSAPGTLSYTNGRIIGQFRRQLPASIVSDVLFPLGDATRYTPALISFTTALNISGDLMAEYVSSASGTNGLPINDGGHSISVIAQEGFWRFTTGEIGSGVYTIDLQATGFGGIADFTKLRIVKRSSLLAAWGVEGTHVQATGSNAVPILHRSGLTNFSDFAVGSTSENPLPIELVSFTAAVTKRAVELTWATATEKENYGFEIERAHYSDNQSAINWEKNGFVPGSGNSNSVKEYHYSDTNPFPGKSLYRLKQLDNDGGFSYSSQVEVDRTLIPEQYNLLQNYPNPFNPATSISFELPRDSHVLLEVYTTTGERIAVLVNGPREAGTHTIWFSPVKEGSGVYFCRFVSGDYSKTIKMIALR